MSRLYHPLLLALLAAIGAATLLHCSDADGGSTAGTTADASSTDGSGSSGSSGSGSDASSDAPASPRCNPNKPFGTPVMVLANSFLIDQSARLSPDELTVYYAGYGHAGVNGDSELWVATRASTSVPFANPKRIDELATTELELYPTVSADGLTIYYDGWLPDAGYGVVTATRASPSAPWSNRALLKGLDLTMVYVSPDGTRLYGARNGAGANADLFFIPLPYDGGAAVQVAGTAAGGIEYWPVVSADGRTIFYSFPTVSPYQWEMQVATRASTSDAFSGNKLVTELNTAADEHPTWLSPDGCTLYFQRVNANIAGNDSGLLAATRGL